MSECACSRDALLIHALDVSMLPISVLAPYLPIPAHRIRDQCAPEPLRVPDISLTDTGF